MLENEKDDNINDLEQNDAGIKNQTKKAENKKFRIYLASVGMIIFLAAIIFISICIVKKRTDLINTVFYNYLINNFLAVPSLLIGLIVFLGYLLQKQPFGDALAGGCKGVVGYLILQTGSAFLTGISKPLMITFGNLIGSKCVLLDPYTGWADVNQKMSEAVSIISFAVLVGMATNIVLVAGKRFTNIRSINVTGHIMFQQTACLTALLWFWVFKDINNESTKQLLTILATGVLIGTYWGVFSNLAYAPTQKVTHNAGFSIGHQQMFGVWAAAQCGKLFASKNNENVSIETFRVSKRLKIFHDSIFISTVLMFLFFGTLFIIIRFNDLKMWNDMIASIGGFDFFTAQGWFIQILGLIFTIVAALQVLMMGAKMFVGELQRSFIGISDRLIPGAIVAIDIAGSFSYSEKSVTYGFISGAVGNFVAIGLVILLGQVIKINAFQVIIMVGFIPMFFDNAAFGIYANSTGGWKACLVVPFVFGMIAVFGAVLIVKVAGRNDSIYTYGYNGMFDWTTMWSGLMVLLTINPSLSYILIFVFIIAFLLIAQLTTTEPGKETRLKKLILNKKTINNVKNNNEDRVENNMQK